jgi:hypothetical protein
MNDGVLGKSGHFGHLHETFSPPVTKTALRIQGPIGIAQMWEPGITIMALPAVSYTGNDNGIAGLDRCHVFSYFLYISSRFMTGHNRQFSPEFAPYLMDVAVTDGCRGKVYFHLICLRRVNLDFFNNQRAPEFITDRRFHPNLLFSSSYSIIARTGQDHMV